ncbi:MAG: hypothetical protein L3K18_07525 [Thermoplasmata archaeon]|nr:hypothetical protein [Thermoplasmata archaeon]MCI4356972.1 hypothetical protein [Thermoplasmata archaeon]
MEIEVTPTGPSSCSVLAKARPIMPLNLFAEFTCDRHVAAVMRAVDAFGLDAGPVRVLTWKEPVPTPHLG